MLSKSNDTVLRLKTPIEGQTRDMHFEQGVANTPRL